MATFCYECVAEWKSEETCIFGRYWLDLAEIWYRGLFLDSKFKTNNKILILCHSDVKMR